MTVTKWLQRDRHEHCCFGRRIRGWSGRAGSRVGSLWPLLPAGSGRSGGPQPAGVLVE